MEIKLKHDHYIKYETEESSFDEIFGEDDNVFMVYDHKDLNITKTINTLKITALDVNKNLAYYKNDYHVYSVWALIHSGITLYLEERQGYDVSMRGYVLVSKSLQLLHPKDEAAAVLIENYNQYLAGEVYRANLIVKEDCDCCGQSVEEDVLDFGTVIGTDVKLNGVLDAIKEYNEDLIVDIAFDK